MAKKIDPLSRMWMLTVGKICRVEICLMMVIAISIKTLRIFLCGLFRLSKINSTCDLLPSPS